METYPLRWQNGAETERGHTRCKLEVRLHSYLIWRCGENTAFPTHFQLAYCFSLLRLCRDSFQSCFVWCLLQHCHRRVYGLHVSFRHKTSALYILTMAILRPAFQRNRLDNYLSQHPSSQCVSFKEGKKKDFNWSSHLQQASSARCWPAAEVCLLGDFESSLIRNGNEKNTGREKQSWAKAGKACVCVYVVGEQRCWCWGSVYSSSTSATRIMELANKWNILLN